MSRSAVVGLFTIIGLALLFGLALVLANVGTGGRYKVGVHFKTAAGLHRGALVYESGVLVGVVDRSDLLPDYSVIVTLAIDKGVPIPRASKFVIQTPITGDVTVAIVPPVPQVAKESKRSAAPPVPEAVPTITPNDLNDPKNIAEGTNPATIQDLLDQGQGEIVKLDRMISELSQREPQMLDALQSALNNANAISVEGNAEIQHLSRQVNAIADQMQTSLGLVSTNFVDSSRQLDTAITENRPRIDQLLTSLNQTSHSLNSAVDSLRDLAQNPQIRANLLDTTRGLATTTTGLGQLVGDLRNVTGNAQTQAQLRDTVANIDASSQKINSLLASFGGTSSVYGVDKGATPAPATSGSPGPSGGAIPGGGKPGAGTNPGNVPGNLKNKLGGLARDLVAVQVRIATLSSQARKDAPASPVLAGATSPQSDFNLVLLPRGSTNLLTGANDLGGRTTWNLAAQGTFPNGFKIGGGVLYSRLGLLGGYTTPQGFGFEGRLYDLKRLTLDGYGTFQVRPGVKLFGGERDLTRDSRRTTLGLQLQF